MSNRKRDCPYRELGRIFEDWRALRFRSALAMFREAQFSFSYYTYADYERGALLPSIDNILELAKYFKVDERPAILRWAEVQMPTLRLKTLFSQVGHRAFPKDIDKEEPHEKQASPSFENTWVFGPQEQEAIRKFPWFFELCQRMAFAYPSGLSHRELGLKKTEFDDLIRDHLQSWIAQGRMHFKDKRLYLACPHIHLPKTGIWQEIRQINLQRALTTLSETISTNTLDSQQAYREIITRTVSDGQIETWVKRLQEVENEFKAMPYTDSASEPGRSTSAKVYSYIAFFGERILRLKRAES